MKHLNQDMNIAVVSNFHGIQTRRLVGLHPAVPVSSAAWKIGTLAACKDLALSQSRRHFA
jgi:uncharacterized protein (DUF1501 family)